MKYISSLALIVALVPGLVMAATSSGVGDTKAKIVTPVNVAENGDLNFGTMVGQAGNVTVSTAGARNSTSDNLVTDSNTPTAGVFTVTGPANQAISIQLPTDAQVTANSSDHMTISTFTSDAGASPNLGSGGSLDIHIGGTLGVGANQPAGDYTGTYTITVNY